MNDANELDFRRDYPRLFALARVLGRGAARTVSTANAILRGLVRILDRLAGVPASQAPVVPVALCAGWLVGMASRMLPAGERGRYGEEWRGELWELAEGRGRRRRQILHAVRLVVRAWPLRAGIREGRRRPAGGG